MSKDYGYIYSDVVVNLQRKRATAEANIKLGESSIVKERECNSMITVCTIDNANITNAQNTLKKWICEVDNYLATKKSQGLQQIKSIISTANNIIPNSMPGIEFKIEGKEAWIETKEGYDIDRTEGSGFRQIVSTMMCRLPLIQNRLLSPFMILDEAFCKISEVTAETLSTYIPILAQGMQILWIEHKSELFQNIPDLHVYEFYLNERRETIARKVSGPERNIRDQVSS